MNPLPRKKRLMTYRFEATSQAVNEVLAAFRELFPDQSAELSVLNESESLTLTLEKTRKKKTRPQENYYRKWCREFAKWAGLTEDEMHEEILCIAFGSDHIETRFGVKKRPIKRSGRIKREEYSELIEHLIITAANMGFAVPPPDYDEDEYG